jgi:HD-GYP domain-containing protein (c-di-GMP phosphodiesterase class II)
VHPDVEQLRPKLKELLYNCAVEIKATKAALYLLDGNTDRFELISEYGFRGDAQKWIDRNNPIVDRCGRARTPFYVNGVAAEPRFAEVLFQALSDRLLAAPLLLRGRLVGLIDMRDKAAKLPFDDTDVAPAQRIGDSILGQLANKNVFGMKFLTLSEAEDEPQDVVTRVSASGWVAIPGSAFVAAPLPTAAPATAAPPPASAQKAPVAPQPQAAPPPKVEPVEPRPLHVPRLATLVADARDAAARILSSPRNEELTDVDLNVVRESLRSIVLIPGVLVSVFTAFGHLGGVQEIVSDAIVTDEARAHLQSKLEKWLAKRGTPMAHVRTNVDSPENPSVPPLTSARLQKVFTAPVSAGTLQGLYLTVAFTESPDRATHEMLAAMLQQLQVAVEYSIARASLATLRSRVAMKLIEPDFMAYPELRRHAEAVASLAERFSQSLSMSPEDVETVRLLAYVHDVGMRVLDYEQLYGKPRLSDDEMEILREHPVVGAAIVEPLLGPRMARAILTHHERADGRGYPNGMRGDEIPLATRIIQVCDAWATMTHAKTYAPAHPPAVAIEELRKAAGTQYDAELTARFIAFISGEAT